MDFLSANMNQCAARPAGDMIWWAIIVSNFSASLLLTLILKWYGAKGILDSLKIGALFGFLFALTIDMSSWSMTTMYNGFGPLVADVAVSTVVLGIVGMVIVLLWGKEKTV
jgi:fluoride ion exporter CrcB/FEX